MSLPYGETVTVQRPAGTDRWGQKLPGTEHQITGCGFAPRTGSAGQRSSAEDNAQHNTVITGLTMYGPPGADITSQDVIVRPDGTRWHVEGEIGHWRSPLTNLAPGIEAAVKRVTG